MVRCVLALLVVACAPGKVTLEGNDDTGGAADGTADTDTAADTGGDTADSGADTATTARGPDLGSFTGTRTFSYDGDWYYCDETVTDEGVAIDESERAGQQLRELCPACDAYFAVTPSETSVCDGLVQLDTSYRAVSFADDVAMVWFYTEQDGELVEYGSDSSAGWDGETVAFDYVYQTWVDVDVTGEMSFPQ